MTEKNRVEQILAVILLNSLKGSSIIEKAHQLSLAGFTNIEIADLLETSTNHIAQSLFKARKKPKGKKKS